MANKTIIDGIDVSKCSWCDYEPNTEPYCRINDGEDLNCEENPNCYYKQLARAKEENEKLKSQLSNNQQEDDRGYCETYDCKHFNNLKECQKQNCWYKNYSKEHIKNVQLKKQLQAKEQECEELKEKLSQVGDIVKPLNSELPEDKVIREIFLIVNDCINEKVNKYKQALDEIEEYCKQNHYCLEPDNRWLSDEIQDIINRAKEQ